MPSGRDISMFIHNGKGAVRGGTSASRSGGAIDKSGAGIGRMQTKRDQLTQAMETG